MKDWSRSAGSKLAITSSKEPAFVAPTMPDQNRTATPRPLLLKGMKNSNYWRLIGAGGMSLLTVLFFVIWQAVARQTDTLNQVMERLGELEKTPQTNNSRLLEEQLHSLKVRLNNQGKTLNDLLEEQQSIAKREEAYIQPQAETWQVQPEPPASLTPPPPELTTP